VLILRIRQAECALADGRLDEAYEIAQADDVRRHHHGQRLIGRLARAIVQRGQENLAAGRFQPALSDCNKAEKLGGNLPEIGQLRAAVCSAIVQEQQGRQQDALRVAQAKQHIEDGWLSVGQRILEEAPSNDGGAELARQQLAAARLKTEDAVAKAEEALRQGDIEEAIRLVQSGRIDQSKNGRTGAVLRQIRGRAVECVRADLEQGRIDRAQSLMQRLGPLGKDGTDVTELREALTWCRQAAQYVVGAEPAAALPLLRKVKTICPSARWLDAAMADIKRAAEAYEELGAGPLGLTMADALPNQGQMSEDEGRKAAGAGPRGCPNGSGQPQGAVPASPQLDGSDPSSLPTKFVLQVDGVGSFLVFREGRVTVGPISSSARPMLALIADPNLPTVMLERVEGDYFVRSATPIHVNGQSVTEKLLADGDHIALSPRCRIKFHLPNPASTTAVLTVSGVRLSRPDIGQLILMDRDILVGPYLNDHIRTDHVKEPVALFAQNGRLLCRAQESILVDGCSFDPSVGLAVDKPVQIGRLSMVVARLGE
jgi:tetratricopeptide (TPR) repeat protein